MSQIAVHSLVQLALPLSPIVLHALIVLIAQVAMQLAMTYLCVLALQATICLIQIHIPAPSALPLFLIAIPVHQVAYVTPVRQGIREIYANYVSLQDTINHQLALTLVTNVLQDVIPAIIRVLAQLVPFHIVALIAQDVLMGIIFKVIFVAYALILMSIVKFVAIIIFVLNVQLAIMHQHV
jgi:hypothetical protein